MKGQLVFFDGTKCEGESFGYERGVAGELAFSTGMTGYPESITDPSYKGQILTLSYPLIGNYGVPSPQLGGWESEKIQISALIVSRYINTPSHFQSTTTLSQWLIKEHIPALEIIDTRFIVKKIRDEGAALAKIEFGEPVAFVDPNKTNLVEQVSTKKGVRYGSVKAKKTIVLIDCGVKQNIIRELVMRNVQVIRVPWDYDFIQEGIACDGVLISNGPGDPKMVQKTIETVKKVIAQKMPLLGICLGNQIVALASGETPINFPSGIEDKTNPVHWWGAKHVTSPLKIMGMPSVQFPRDLNHGLSIVTIKQMKELFIRLCLLCPFNFIQKQHPGQ